MDGRDSRTYAIIGAAMDVHSELGPGFLESVYQRALAIRFREKGVPHRREVALDVSFHGESVGSFRADFVCHDSIVVELKAQVGVRSSEISQLANYLRATGHRLGVLLNFGSTSLQFHRVIDGRALPKRHDLDGPAESVSLPTAAGQAPEASVESVSALTPPTATPARTSR